jgi:hypothetical protein
MAGPNYMRSPIFGTPQVPTGMLGLGPQTAPSDMRRKRQFQGVADTLTQLGIGLMGQGPSATPQSPLQGLATGLQGANAMSAQRAQESQNERQMQMAEAQFGMQQEEFGLKKQEMEYEQIRRQKMEELISGLPKEMQDAARADPDSFWKAYAESKFPKESGPQSAIAKARADLAAGRMTQPEYDAFVQKETYIRPPDQVNVNASMPKLESAFATSFGKGEGEAAAALANDVGASAASQLEQLSALKQAVAELQASGGDTNAAAPLKLKATQIAQALGLDPTSFGLPENAGPAELINSISNKLAMQARNPAGGAGMPGAMSDADRAFLSQTVPGLDNSPQGMAAKIDVAEKVAQRQSEMSYLWNSGRYEQTQEGFRQFKKDWADYTKAHPLFTTEDRQRMNRQTTIGAPKTTGPVDAKQKSNEQLLQELGVQ